MEINYRQHPAAAGAVYEKPSTGSVILQFYGRKTLKWICYDEKWQRPHGIIDKNSIFFRFSQQKHHA